MTRRISAASAKDSQRLDCLWKTIEGSPGRLDIARRTEASEKKACRCKRVVRIDGESSQFSMLSILPQTQCPVSPSDIGWNLGVARIELLRPLIIHQRALPFTAPAVNGRAVESSQSIVGLQLQCAVELRQRVLILATPVIKE